MCNAGILLLTIYFWVNWQTGTVDGQRPAQMDKCAGVWKTSTHYHMYHTTPCHTLHSPIHRLTQRGHTLDTNFPSLRRHGMLVRLYRMTMEPFVFLSSFLFFNLHRLYPTANLPRHPRQNTPATYSTYRILVGDRTTRLLHTTEYGLLVRNTSSTISNIVGRCRNQLKR